MLDGETGLLDRLHILPIQLCVHQSVNGLIQQRVHVTRRRRLIQLLLDRFAHGAGGTPRVAAVGVEAALHVHQLFYHADVLDIMLLRLLHQRAVHAHGPLFADARVGNLAPRRQHTCLAALARRNASHRVARHGASRRHHELLLQVNHGCEHLPTI